MTKTRMVASGLLAGLLFAVFGVGSAIAIQSIGTEESSFPEGATAWTCPPFCG